MARFLNRLKKEKAKMKRKSLTLTPEYWTQPHKLRESLTHRCTTDDTLWNISALEDGYAKLWSINGWGVPRYRNVELPLFCEEYVKRGVTQ